MQNTVVLNTTQVTELAKSFVGMVDTLREFFEDPQVKKDYEEWHIKKYGCMPENEV